MQYVAHSLRLDARLSYETSRQEREHGLRRERRERKKEPLTLKAEGIRLQHV
jgi:hypothetical protein